MEQSRRQAEMTSQLIKALFFCQEQLRCQLRPTFDNVFARESILVCGMRVVSNEPLDATCDIAAHSSESKSSFQACTNHQSAFLDATEEATALGHS